MKHPLPFTLFCCFFISSMYAVQEQSSGDILKEEAKIETIKQDSKIINLTSNKVSVVISKNTKLIANRKNYRTVGPIIKKSPLREIIDRRKRIVENY